MATLPIDKKKLASIMQRMNMRMPKREEDEPMTTQNLPDKLIISRELAQAIANYLLERPYKEVAMMMQELARLQAFAPPASGLTEAPQENGAAQA